MGGGGQRLMRSETVLLVINGFTVVITSWTDKKVDGLDQLHSQGCSHLHYLSCCWVWSILYLTSNINKSYLSKSTLYIKIIIRRSNPLTLLYNHPVYIYLHCFTYIFNTIQIFGPTDSFSNFPGGQLTLPTHHRFHRH